MNLPKIHNFPHYRMSTCCRGNTWVQEFSNLLAFVCFVFVWEEGWNICIDLTSSVLDFEAFPTLLLQIRDTQRVLLFIHSPPPPHHLFYLAIMLLCDFKNTKPVILSPILINSPLYCSSSLWHSHISSYQFHLDPANLSSPPPEGLPQNGALQHIQQSHILTAIDRIPNVNSMKSHGSE